MIGFYFLVSFGVFLKNYENMVFVARIWLLEILVYIKKLFKNFKLVG